MNENDVPQPGALLSLNQAKQERRCRICGETIIVAGAPAGWMEDFGSQVYPIKITLNFGEEFAHTDCLPHE